MAGYTQRLFVLVAVVAISIGAGCGGNDDSSVTDTGDATASSATPRTKPVTLRLGYFPNITHAPALIGVKDGTFEQELGDLVKLETRTFNAGPSVIEALFAKQIDISFVGPSPAINGYMQSNGEALRVISGSTSGGALLIVRPAANIATAKDFANKKIATPQLGNTQDVALRSWLKENGLKAKEQGGNVTVLATENATALTLFQKGDIDGAWVPEPWATRLMQQAGGKIFLDEKSLWPGGRFATTQIVVRTDYLKKNPDVVEDFLRANVRVIQGINADPEKAKATTNDAIKEITNAALPKEVIDAAWKNLEFTWDPVASSLKASADKAFALGFLGLKKPNLSEIYALAILNSVLAELQMPAVKGF